MQTGTTGCGDKATTALQIHGRTSGRDDVAPSARAIWWDAWATDDALSPPQHPCKQHACCSVGGSPDVCLSKSAERDAQPDTSPHPPHGGTASPFEPLLAASKDHSERGGARETDIEESIVRGPEHDATSSSSDDDDDDGEEADGNDHTDGDDDADVCEQKLAAFLDACEQRCPDGVRDAATAHGMGASKDVNERAVNSSTAKSVASLSPRLESMRRVRKFDLAGEAPHMCARVTVVVGQRQKERRTMAAQLIGLMRAHMTIADALVVAPCAETRSLFARLLAPNARIRDALDEQDLDAFLDDCEKRYKASSMHARGCVASTDGCGDLHANGEHTRGRDGAPRRALLVLFDCFDYSAASKSRALRRAHYNLRHMDMAVINVASSMCALPPSVRGAADYVFAFHHASLRDRQCMHKLSFAAMPLADFDDLFDSCTEQGRAQYHCMVLDRTVCDAHGRQSERVFWYMADPAAAAAATPRSPQPHAPDAKQTLSAPSSAVCDPPRDHRSGTTLLSKHPAAAAAAAAAADADADADADARGQANGSTCAWMPVWVTWPKWCVCACYWPVLVRVPTCAVGGAHALPAHTWLSPLPCGTQATPPVPGLVSHLQTQPWPWSFCCVQPQVAHVVGPVPAPRASWPPSPEPGAPAPAPTSTSTFASAATSTSTSASASPRTAPPPSLAMSPGLRPLIHTLSTSMAAASALLTALESLVPDGDNLDQPRRCS